MQSFCIRAIPRKPRRTLLNRGPRILLVLSYFVDRSILRILTQAVSKNIDPFRFYEYFTKSPTIHPIHQGGHHVTISHELLNRFT